MSRHDDFTGLIDVAAETARFLSMAKRVEVLAHIDADGITSASIASMALDRAGIDHSVHFIKKLDPVTIEKINLCGSDAVWLVDLGSGSYSLIEHEGACISDHHVPNFNGQTCLTAYFGRHMNPHLHGKDGSVEICGAGVTYLVAKMMDRRNQDLSPLAIVGAVGDFQDSSECRLTGMNRHILQDAEEMKLIKAFTDIRLFGRETRPLARMLQYSSDPFLPGLTGNYSNCKETLQILGLIPENGGSNGGTPESDDFEGSNRRWIDLDPEEKKRLASWLCEFLLHNGLGSRAVRRLMGEVYVLPGEEKGTPLHDAKEFATLLNACGRYGKAKMGMEVCKGDRDQHLKEALRMLGSHRRYLSESIGLLVHPTPSIVKGEVEASSTVAGNIPNDSIIIIPFGKNIRYFQADERIPDTIVGIVTGMYLGSNHEIADRPLIGMAPAQDEPGKVKVSARGTKELVRMGLDLARAMRLASERVGGVGGGHAIAAGATIEMGKENEFLQEIDSIVANQLTDANREA
ncbi:MAG TPA: DHH family phosphoesterase [Methanomassiliicoccales archaeon]|nr:DHH family phosphoesterase [Methanomassiliicoccales archaeon]